jgi:predicted ATP-binding protein involved in virulence
VEGCCLDEALCHLLQGQQDALLLLEEPETHFNDKWKREIVDIIDDAIGNTANDVLISTHSAIVLSDVFNDEIVMVEKNANGSGVRTVVEPTFAADPSALMMTVFGAEDSIGELSPERPWYAVHCALLAALLQQSSVVLHSVWNLTDYWRG